MIAVEVLFKRTAEDRFVSIGGECAREDRDVPECGFKGFVEDV